MRYFVHLDGRRIEVQLDGDELRVEGVPVEVDLAPGGRASVRSLRVGDRSIRVLSERDAQGCWTLEVDGVPHKVEVLDRAQDSARAAKKAAAGAAGPSPLRAPMPGLVVRVEVALGDVVEAGQGVVIVEAMKMENELKAPTAGRVSAVKVQQGATVERHQVLVEFEEVGAGE
jgi:biotin carboxyl carrier protein